MGTEAFTGAKTETNPESLILDTGKLYETLRDLAVARRIFPDFSPRVDFTMDAFEITDVIDDLKTGYGKKSINYPEFRQSLRPKKFDLFRLYGKLKFDRDQLDKINAGKLPFSKRLISSLGQVAEDEDMYTIAGESTESGVTSFADTTNFSTAATTQLDLTTMQTLTTSFNAMGAQLTAALKTATGGLRNTKLAPLILLVTNDVWERFLAMSSSSTANDERAFDGIDKINQLLAKRGGPGSGLEVSDHLGATVARDGNAFKVTADGTTNACLMSQHVNHYGVASSGVRQHPALQPDLGLEYLIDEVIVPYSVIQESMIMSATVDITA